MYESRSKQRENELLNEIESEDDHDKYPPQERNEKRERW